MCSADSLASTVLGTLSIPKGRLILLPIKIKDQNHQKAPNSTVHDDCFLAYMLYY